MHHGLELTRPELLKTAAFVDGKWQEGEATFSVVNPADGHPLCDLPDFGADQTRKGIEAASRALPAWRKQTALARAKVLRTWYDCVMDNQDDLARILTAEQGKPLAEAQDEIAYGASYIEWFAEQAKRIDGDILPSASTHQRLFVLRQPVGVVAAITPWNFPNAMIARKAAAALAAGCTMVCRPASETPLSTLALATLAQEAGVPDGVFNVVVGKDARAMGEVLSRHPLVKKLTFTGSTEVGKSLMAQCATSCKRTSMELGGNAPFIVFDDADIDAAVTGLVASKFRNSGQTCVCANRIFVQAGIHDRFVEKLLVAVATFSLGDGRQDSVTHGPLINAKAVEGVAALVDEACREGASALTGAQTSKLGPCFYEPTVLIDVKPHMRLFKEEIFGPVAPIYRFDHEDDVIALANDTAFGLAAYFYTRDMARTFRVADALDYGMIGINEGVISNAMAPFGGMKESGHGREGSKYGLDDYLEMKSLCLSLKE